MEIMEKIDIESNNNSNNKSKNYDLYFYVIIIFGLVGSYFLGMMGHELYHKWDLMGTVSNGEICLLEYPTFDSSYSFQVEEGYKYDRVNSEIIPYFIGVIPTVVMFGLIYIRGKKKK